MVIHSLKNIEGEGVNTNAVTIERELEWLAGVIDTRMKLHFGKECEFDSIYMHRLPSLEGDTSIYADFVRYYNLSFDERVILLLALLPHIKPRLLDVFFARNTDTDRGFTEFGGLKGSAHSGFLPTGETAFFVLAGDDLGKRFSLNSAFGADHFFQKHNILHLEHINSNEPPASGLLLLTDEFIDYLTIGRPQKPKFGMEFPAKLINTPMEWKDLVVDEYTARQIEEIRAWINHGEKLMNEWGMSKKLKPGYKILFYGPPGTGKTLTACLFGKLSGREVYRIDLSMIVSKYIGETEKNLEKVFRKAENKNWVLFFDEADAVFGKRTGVSDSHDKYANQEVSYLLQRLEDYNGLIILASNLKSNIDDAFSRRLQAVINFPMPKPKERYRLWENSYSEKAEFEKSVNLKKFSEKYELAGGSIMNVVRYSSLMALERGENVIRLADIVEGIKKEYEKEGKTV